MKILNLGCNTDMYGTHRVDKFKTISTTHVHDLENGIPFEDNLFDEIFEKNLLEHLRNVGFHLDECHRVLKFGGKLRIITDNASCIRYYFGTHTGKYEKQHEDDHHYCIFTMNHLKNHLEAADFQIKILQLIKTDTLGRIFDSKLTQFTMPRIYVEAIK